MIGVYRCLFACSSTRFRKPWARWTWNQWDFHVLLTKVLDERMGERKTFTLKQLEELGAMKCGYGGIMGADLAPV